MRTVPPELLAALAAQQAGRRAALRAGAAHAGWKLGLGERERIAGERPIGYLTSATRLDQGGTYHAGTARLSADAEVAVHLGEDVAPGADAAAALAAVAGYAPALELVDLSGTDDAGAIVAANVWHRAFALGPPRQALPPDPFTVTLLVNGEARAQGSSPVDLSDRVLTAAWLLGGLGERLRAGDWLITGGVVQVPVRPGERVVADFTGLGRVDLAIAGPSPRTGG
jgi:2-keto-4-pentenoate hydratase